MQLEAMLSKARKGTYFAIGSDVVKSAKKVPLKINDVSVKIQTDVKQPLAPLTNDTQVAELIFL